MQNGKGNKEAIELQEEIELICLAVLARFGVATCSHCWGCTKPMGHSGPHSHEITEQDIAETRYPKGPEFR